MAIAQHGFESEKVMDRLSSDLTKEAKDLQIAEDKAVTVEELEKILIKSIKTNSICKDYLENK